MDSFFSLIFFLKGQKKGENEFFWKIFFSDFFFWSPKEPIFEKKNEKFSDHKITV